MRRSGPPNVTLAIIGASVPAAEPRTSGVIVPAAKWRSHAATRSGSPSSSSVSTSPLGRERDEPLGVDERDPQVAVGVEGEPVGDAAEVGRSVDLPVDELPVRQHPEPGNAPPVGLHHVEPLLRAVETDLVRADEAVRDDSCPSSSISAT